MLLSDELKIRTKDLISVVGAGGKTSLILKIAKECRKRNLKVLVTTTTKIFYPKENYIDNIILLDKEDIDINSIKKGTIMVIADSLTKDNKLIGAEKTLIDNLYKKNIFDIILVEADGAKRKTIKVPNSSEPVIPSLTTKVIGVIGIDALGLEIDDRNVHRVNEFLNISGGKKGEIINNKIIEKVVISKKGLFKNIPKDAEKILILNKADNEILQKKAYDTGKGILKRNSNLNIIITSILKNYFRRCKL